MPKKQIDIQKAIRLYRDEKWPSTKVSKEVGCAVQTLITRLREHGVEIRSCGNHMEKVSFEIMRHEYEDLEMSTETIAKKYKMSASSVWERLKRGGVKLRDQKEALVAAIIKIPISEHPIICQRYIDNIHENSSDIAKDYKVHKTTISTILKQGGLSLSREGTRNPNYKGGITPLHTRIRHCDKYKHWRKECMTRDDFTCQVSGQRGGRLQVHHTKPFSMILEEFLEIYPGRSDEELFDIAQDHIDFWNLEWGTTISEEFHDEIHKHQIDEDMAVPVVCMYKGGKTIHQISQSLKCSWHTVDRILTLLNFK